MAGTGRARGLSVTHNSAQSRSLTFLGKIVTNVHLYVITAVTVNMSYFIEMCGYPVSTIYLY